MVFGDFFLRWLLVEHASLQQPYRASARAADALALPNKSSGRRTAVIRFSTLSGNRCIPAFRLPSAHPPLTLITAEVKGSIVGLCPLKVMHEDGFARERTCHTTRQNQLDSLVKKAEVSREVF